MIKLFSILIAIVSLLTIPFLVFDGFHPAVEMPPILQEKDGQVIASQNNYSSGEIHPSIEVKNVLEADFCSLQVCGPGDWQQWIMLTPDQPWKAEELEIVGDILTIVIVSLNDQGLDGRTLLNGYHFRRQHGEYIIGHEGRIAVVNHDEQIITLADAAFKRLHGFYIIHELGHIVDKRTDRELSKTFHHLAGSDLERGQTAEGYWLNLHGRDDLEEAAADAFALWILSKHDPGYKPVFAYTPPSTKYERIEELLIGSLDEVELRQ